MNQLIAATAPDKLESPWARDDVLELRSRIGKSVLGQDHPVESMPIGLLADGNRPP